MVVAKFSKKLHKNRIIQTTKTTEWQAFAPLALKVPIIINEAEVVSKSFPMDRFKNRSV
jgi:hypothetical protein